MSNSTPVKKRIDPCGEPIGVFDALESEQYGTSFGRENGTVILNVMTVAVINENCCYRDPLSVFRTVSVEWDVSWESISYGEILIVVCDGWRVRLPRRGELEDDVRSLELPRRRVRHVVQFEPQVSRAAASEHFSWTNLPPLESQRPKRSEGGSGRCPEYELWSDILRPDSDLRSLDKESHAAVGHSPEAVDGRQVYVTDHAQSVTAPPYVNIYVSDSYI